MTHYRRHCMLFPEFRWFHRFSFEADDGETYRGFVLKLPIWGYGYDIRNDEPASWGQRWLFWHGRDGFRLFWHFPPDDSALSVTRPHPPLRGH